MNYEAIKSILAMALPAHTVEFASVAFDAPDAVGVVVLYGNDGDSINVTESGDVAAVEFFDGETAELCVAEYNSVEDALNAAIFHVINN